MTNVLMGSQRYLQYRLIPIFIASGLHLDDFSSETRIRITNCFKGVKRKKNIYLIIRILYYRYHFEYRLLMFTGNYRKPLFYIDFIMSTQIRCSKTLTAET